MDWATSSQVVVLVGGMRCSGKTSLLLRLAFGSFTERHAETHGVHEQQCELAVSETKLRLVEVGRGRAGSGMHGVATLCRSVCVESSARGGGGVAVVVFVVDSTVAARELMSCAGVEARSGAPKALGGDDDVTRCAFSYVRYLAGMGSAPAASRRMPQGSGVLPGTPLLVLCNKQDEPGALSASEVATALELSKLSGAACSTSKRMRRTVGSTWAQGGSLELGMERAWACLPVSMRTGAGFEQAQAWLSEQLARRAFA